MTGFRRFARLVCKKPPQVPPVLHALRQVAHHPEWTDQLLWQVDELQFIVSRDFAEEVERLQDDLEVAARQAEVEVLEAVAEARRLAEGGEAQSPSAELTPHKFNRKARLLRARSGSDANSATRAAELAGASRNVLHRLRFAAHRTARLE